MRTEIADNEAFEQIPMRTCLNELMNIFRHNYCRDEKFKKQLFKELSKATGNDNLSRICGEIIDL
jgi:hypothetical protein